MASRLIEEVDEASFRTGFEEGYMRGIKLMREQQGGSVVIPSVFTAVDECVREARAKRIRVGADHPK